MNEPLRNAKVGASMLAAYGYAPIQWKIALARMQEANMAATEITPQGELTRPAIRQIAEYHLDRYFEMIEAQLSQLRRRQVSE
jgi:hypothetical protein